MSSELNPTSDILLLLEDKVKFEFAAYVMFDMKRYHDKIKTRTIVMISRFRIGI